MQLGVLNWPKNSANEGKGRSLASWERKGSGELEKGGAKQVS